MAIAHRRMKPQTKAESLKYLQQKSQRFRNATLASLLTKREREAEIKSQVYNRELLQFKNPRTPAGRLMGLWHSAARRVARWVRALMKVPCMCGMYFCSKQWVGAQALVWWSDSHSKNEIQFLCLNNDWCKRQLTSDCSQAREHEGMSL